MSKSTKKHKDEREQRSESSDDEEIWESSDDSLDDVDPFSVLDSDSDTSEEEMDSLKKNALLKLPISY